MKKTFKKITAVFLAVIISSLCLVVGAFAQGEEYLVYEYNDKSGVAYVIDCDEGAEGIITVPSIVKKGSKSYNVTYVGEKAFEGCMSVNTIILPEGITSIGNHAFRDCIALTDVYIPESLVMCQTDAFNGCNIVTVHCFSTNYQFFTVYGLAENIKIDIQDSEQGDVPGTDGEGDTNMTNSIIAIIKAFIYRLLAFLGVVKGETV